MYGTVARLHIKPGMESKFMELGRAQQSANIPGYVASYVYQMDGDPSEFYLTVVFTSKEAYLENAGSPEQHARFQELMSVMAAEPEWHDGEIVSQ